MKFSTLLITIILFAGFMSGFISFINLNIPNTNTNDEELKIILEDTKKISEELQNRTLNIQEKTGFIADLTFFTNILTGTVSVIKYSLVNMPLVFIKTINYISAQLQIPSLFVGIFITVVIVSLIFTLIKALMKWEI